MADFLVDITVVGVPDESNQGLSAFDLAVRGYDTPKHFIGGFGYQLRASLRIRPEFPANRLNLSQLCWR
jgi:hypothetical protein